MLGDRTVSPFLLGGIQPFIRALEQSLGAILAFKLHHTTADRHTDRRGAGWLIPKLAPGEPGDDLCQPLFRLRERHVGQQQRELVAPVPELRSTIHRCGRRYQPFSASWRFTIPRIQQQGGMKPLERAVALRYGGRSCGSNRQAQPARSR